MRLLLLAPAVIALCLFTLWPLGEVVRLSLVQTNFITTKFVGLSNYANVFDPQFVRSILNSVLYMALMMVLTVGGALLVSLTAFFLSKRWQDATRFIFYIPVLSAGVIISQVWKWVFHINGPINWLLGVVGMTPVAFVSHWYTAIPMVSIVVSTSGMGGTIIILLASMMSIDPALFDAAAIDGASARQVRWRIVVPIIAPTLGLVSLLAMLAAPQIFETIYAMAPQDHAATMAFYIYRQAFQMSRYGMASAQAVVLLVFLGFMAYLKQRFVRA